MPRENPHAPRPEREEMALPRTRERIARSIDDELRLHLEERVEELKQRGLTTDDAIAQAQREFGDVGATSAALRTIDERAARLDSLRELFADIGTDVRRAARGLARRPVFALTAIITLALGIGANVVMFGLIDRLLLSPPPHVQDAERIVRLRYNLMNNNGGRITWIRASYPAYTQFAQRTDLFEGVAAYSDRALTLAVGNQARELSVAAVTEGYFSVLGVRPRFGRFIAGDPTDDRAVVLSYALWMQQFAGDASVIGRKVQLGGEPFTVVGVAPLGFGGEGSDRYDAWIAASRSTPTLSPEWMSAERPRVAFMFARIREGVTPARVAQEGSRLYRATLATAGIPDSTAYLELRSVLAGRDTEHGGLTSSARVAMWLQAVSVLLLIIAIANVVNLLLLRAMDRQREASVSLALGISRSRLIRHLSLESLLLAMAGGAAAMALAIWLGPALWAVVLPRAPDAEEVRGRLVAMTAAIVLVCTALMTTAPAIAQRAWSGIDALRSGGRGATGRTSLIGDALVILQVALTVVLLVGAGLFTRSLNRLANTDIGFDPSRLVGARLTTVGGADTAARTALFMRVEEALRRMPGAQSVAAGLSSPLRPSITLPIRLPGKENLPGVGKDALGFPIAYAASPEFIETLGIRLLRGRNLARGDHAGAQRVMLVDATMARTFWPNADPLGQCVQIGADSIGCTTVVGVVADTKRGLLDRQHTLRYYLPMDQAAPGLRERYFFVRSARVDQRLVDQVRAVIIAQAPSAPFVEAFAIEGLLDDYTQQWRLGSTAFVAFGMLATVVAAIGLFGTISFGVSRREREFGIRRALGEPTGRLLRRVIGGATRRSALGLAIGCALGVLLSKRLQELLFRPAASDTMVFAVAAMIILGVTIVASAWPAGRAVRVHPLRAIRAE